MRTRPMLTLALATACLYATSAHAGDTKRFSVSVNTGIISDMAGLGATIMQDGSIDTADSTMANAVYATGQILMSDRDNMTIDSNSKNTDSNFHLLDGYETGGPMLGIEVGGDLRYEFDDLLGFPLFLRAGFHLHDRMTGGQQSRTLGTAAIDDGRIAALLALNGLDANDYVGGTMATNWDAGWFEIPISLGWNLEINPYTSLYASFGVSWFKGGFSVGLEVDEAYANVLATHLDADTMTATNLSPGSVSDVAKFDATAMGLNYGLGAQAHITSGLSVFLELNSSGAGATVFSNTLTPEAQQLLTSTSSASLAEGDPTWFKKLAYPVVFGGSSVRIGVRYYVF